MFKDKPKTNIIKLKNLKKMKKLFIVLLAIFMTSNTVVFANNSNIEIISQDGPTCVDTGNVSVSIDYRRNVVSAYNYNDYRVTVSYEVWGYNNGKLQQIGGGTMSLGTTDVGRSGSQSFSSGYTGCFLKNVRVQKCS